MPPERALACSRQAASIVACAQTAVCQAGVAGEHRFVGAPAMVTPSTCLPRRPIEYIGSRGPVFQAWHLKHRLLVPGAFDAGVPSGVRARKRCEAGVMTVERQKFSARLILGMFHEAAEERRTPADPS